jgi:hypothetical protein
MNKILIITILLFAGVATPELTNEAKAQERKVVVHRKGKVGARNVHRKARRRVTRRAHIRYRGLPKYGAVVTAIPTRAIVLKSGYYYIDGVYYEKRGSSFIVVRPRHGIRIRVLPPAHKVVAVSNQNYYYYYGTFYQATNDGEYEVIEAPVGALVDALPEGYEVKEIDGLEYYLLDGIYYQEVETNEFKEGIGYEVVKL